MFWLAIHVGLCYGIMQYADISGPVSTGMSDRIGVQLPVWDIYLGNQPPRPPHPAKDWWPFAAGE